MELSCFAKTTLNVPEKHRSEIQLMSTSPLTRLRNKDHRLKTRPDPNFTVAARLAVSVRHTYAVTTMARFQLHEPGSPLHVPSQAFPLPELRTAPQQCLSVALPPVRPFSNSFPIVPQSRVHAGPSPLWFCLWADCAAPCFYF